ncbi:MAG: inositol monophosphatase [Tabrizicola sp.]|nr:inositol monophosphatase [Tabrizicola sp.]
MQQQDAPDRLSAILEEAGAEALAFFNRLGARKVDTKAPGDFVSDADRAVEVTLRRLLERDFPGIPVLGEEYGGETGARYWAVDPIDGTSNFLSGLPFWTISLGLIEDGEPVLGGIIAPVMGLMAAGSVDGLHETGLSPESRPAASPCIGMGRNPRWPLADRQATEALIIEADLAPRILGSCALALMLVATGRLLGYIEPRVGGMWDCAGGLALCRAAGVPYRFRQHPDGTVDVAAGGVFGLLPIDW